MSLTELRVHHKTAAGLIVQLPNGGFGRLTRESCGGDALADHILKHFAPQDSILCGNTGQSDKDGYSLMSTDLTQLSAQLRFTRKTETAALVTTLFRLNVLCGLGRVVRAKVVTRRDEGAVLKLHNQMAAVCLGKLPEPAAPAVVSAPSADDDDEAASSIAASPTAFAVVRVLAFDDRAKGGGIATCTADPAVVRRGYSSADEFVQANPAKSCFVGDIVSCRVLLNCELRCVDDVVRRIVVAEVVPEAPSSSVGHVHYRDSETAPAHAKTQLVYITLKADAPAPKVGSTTRVQLTFVPSSSLVAGLPFSLGSLEHVENVGVPRSRHFPDLSQTVVLPFPWRDPKVNAAEEEANNQENALDEQKLRRRRVEEAIDRYERQGDVAPTSPDEFDKQLLATPNSSYLWTQYMAYHIALRRVDAARTVAEKALSRIPVTEVADLTNVWVAYLNLENTYGTAESLAAVFRRAVERTDDQLLIHEKLADIFSATGKKQQLVELCRSMTGKFRKETRVWERLAKALIDTGKRDQVKRMLKEMADALPIKEHVPAVIHIAIHEYRNGAPEQGRALMEGLVAKSSKRSDIWSTFIDQELALIARQGMEASVPGVRHIFERVATVSLAPKVMQGFLTRWLAFEQQNGTPAQIQHVKDKARAYVESRAAAASAAVV